MKSPKMFSRVRAQGQYRVLCLFNMRFTLCFTMKLKKKIAEKNENETRKGAKRLIKNYNNQTA